MEQEPAAVAEKPPVLEGEHIPAPADTLSEFASLAKMLAEAGDNKRRKDEAIDGIEAALGKLSAVDMPELVQHPTIQKLLGMVSERRVERGVRPGDIVGEGLSRTKQPWRKEDLTPENGFEYVEYTPTENIPVVWNGIAISFVEGIKLWMPKVFLDVYNESRRAKRAAAEHQAMLFATRAQRDNGQNNGVPSDPSMLVGAQGARSNMLRGAWDGGEFKPGHGLGVIVPDADRPGIEGESDEGEGQGEDAA